MLPLRARLPAFNMGAEVCAAVRASQVSIVLGATGCGKTTQIPQLILEAEVEAGRPCRILASQPRRLSASSVAERVAVERGSRLGSVVGYKVRFEEEASEETLLLFCTVGILLKAMQSNPTLDGATHIIVDEVHERDLHTDFLLSLLRVAARERPDLRIILMSATVDPTAFREYFPGAQEVTIPGRTNYPIEELFLEDVLPLLPPASPNDRKQRAPSAFADGPLPGVPLDPAGVAAALPHTTPAIAAQLAAAHSAMADDVDLDLVVRTVLHIHFQREEGAVLVFVPGWAEIAEIVKRLTSSTAARDLLVLPLHSRMPTAEQREIFDSPRDGARKVVVATILAETSITIEDVVYVVDTGRTKSTSVSASSLVPTLRTVWYARANGMQRRGRAGRCRPGVWYRLYSSLQWGALDEHATPEMLRAPLEELCLEVGALRLGPPEEFLATAISPPDPAAVRRALSLLRRLGAMADARGTALTALGERLAALRVHPTLGKMLLLAGLFGCYGPVLTIAAALGYRSPFLCPLGKEREADLCKRELAAGSESDHVALANAYEGWLRHGRARFASTHFLSHQTLSYVHQLRGELADAARDAFSGSIPDECSTPRQLDDIVRACLVAGLLPNVAWLRRWGKGETMEGLQVTAHPGSVNSRASGSLVVFYDIQETSARYLYDTSRVQMAPVLLFAHELPVVHRAPQRVTVLLGGRWRIAIAADAADELLRVRELLAEFIQLSVGRQRTPAHAAATNAINRLFSDHAPVIVDEDDEESVAEQEEGRWRR